MYKNIHSKNIHSSPIHISQKLESTQKSINSRINKYSACNFQFLDLDSGYRTMHL